MDRDDSSTIEPSHDEDPRTARAEPVRSGVVEHVRRTASRNFERWVIDLAEAARYGPVAEIVRTITPHTEGDPNALLVLLLVGLGSVVGRRPYFQVENTKHYLNEFVVLVGETAKARKGTITERMRGLFKLVEALVNERINHLYALTKQTNDSTELQRLMELQRRLPGRLIVKTGLSSGEGLIWAVRDPIQSTTMHGKDDAGVFDKRLLVVEQEFASPLRVMARQGNILSPILRDSWDCADVLQTLTKNQPAIATNAHISLVGHITRDELRKYLDRSELGNGFANRFLWLYVKRRSFLPHGGHLLEADLLPFAERVADIVFKVENEPHQRITMSATADELWNDMYRELSQGKPGLLGAVTARAEAHTMRLAALYALWDASYVIEPDHLKAALAVWDYCERSALYIFGNALGNPEADEILRHLRVSTAGLTRTEIRDIFKRNRMEWEIELALDELATHGLAMMQTEPSSQHGGRLTERWFAINATWRQDDLRPNPASAPGERDAA